MNGLDSIISGCIENDRKSQEILFKMFYGKMLSVAMRYTVDNDSAEEILQEAFIKAFDKLPTYSGGVFEGWLRRIVVNTAIDKIRKEKRTIFIDDGIKIEDTYFLITKDDEFEFETSDVSEEKLIKIIQSLPGRYRAVFNMYVIDGMSHKEIAEELGIVEGTSKSNYHKAKAFVRKRLFDAEVKTK